MKKQTQHNLGHPLLAERSSAPFCSWDCAAWRWSGGDLLLNENSSDTSYKLISLNEKQNNTKKIQEQWLIFFFPKVKFSALCLKNTFTVLDTYKGKKKKLCVCVLERSFFFQSLLNRLLKDATVAACILFSFGDGVLVYIIYIKIS